MTATPQSNRQQRRAQSARQSSNGRWAKMSRAQKDAYVARAKLWSKGLRLEAVYHDGERGWLPTFPVTTLPHRQADALTFAMKTPRRWSVTARAHFRYSNGDTETREATVDAGQALKLDELEVVFSLARKAALQNANERFIHKEDLIVELLS